MEAAQWHRNCDDDDDEEEDGDEDVKVCSSSLPVQIGVPGEYIRSRSHETKTTSKIGGAPVWLSTSPPPRELLQCSGCKNYRMKLLAQVHAPATEGCERCVYVVTCLNKSCKSPGFHAFSIECTREGVMKAAGTGGGSNDSGAESVAGGDKETKGGGGQATMTRQPPVAKEHDDGEKKKRKEETEREMMKRTSGTDRGGDVSKKEGGGGTGESAFEGEGDWGVDAEAMDWGGGGGDEAKSGDRDGAIAPPAGGESCTKGEGRRNEGTTRATSCEDDEWGVSSDWGGGEFGTEGVEGEEDNAEKELEELLDSRERKKTTESKKDLAKAETQKTRTTTTTTPGTTASSTASSNFTSKAVGSGKDNKTTRDLEKSSNNDSNGGEGRGDYKKKKDWGGFRPFYLCFEEERPKAKRKITEREKKIIEDMQKEMDKRAGGDKKEEGGWDGEKYEDIPQADKSFVRFARRVELHPEQATILRHNKTKDQRARFRTPAFFCSFVLRYDFGGRPLRMSNAPTSPVPICPRCSRKRVFEMQLMPALISVLEPNLRTEWEGTD
eukprot:jgi/Bigna1/79186/fgenesh1_pg.60_\